MLTSEKLEGGAKGVEPLGQVTQARGVVKVQ